MTPQSPLCPCCRRTYIQNSELRISDEDYSKESTCIDGSSGDFESGRQTQAESNRVTTSLLLLSSHAPRLSNRAMAKAVNVTMNLKLFIIVVA
jgi:hypothetical protein